MCLLLGACAQRDVVPWFNTTGSVVSTGAQRYAFDASRGPVALFFTTPAGSAPAITYVQVALTLTAGVQPPLSVNFTVGLMAVIGTGLGAGNLFKPSGQLLASTSPLSATLGGNSTQTFTFSALGALGTTGLSPSTSYSLVLYGATSPSALVTFVTGGNYSFGGGFLPASGGASAIGTSGRDPTQVFWYDMNANSRLLASLGFWTAPPPPPPSPPGAPSPPPPPPPPTLAGLASSQVNASNATALAGVVNSILNVSSPVVGAALNATDAVAVLNFISTVAANLTLNSTATAAAAVANFAAQALAGGGGNASSGVLTNVSAAANSIAQTLAANVCAAPNATLTVGTPQVNITAACVAGTSSGPLPAQAILPPANSGQGNTSVWSIAPAQGRRRLFGFGPRAVAPASTVPATVSATTLKFDPYAAPGAATTASAVTLTVADSSGMTLSASNLSRPLTLSVPTPVTQPGGANGTTQTPTLWNAASKTYTTSGLAAIPNPSPPGLVLDWVPGFNTTSDAGMALAWAVVNLTAACTDNSLNCATQQGLVVSLCPTNNTATVVGCSPGSTGIIRVFSGCSCPLADPTQNCFWDVSTQAFVGPGCALAPSTRIATRNLPGASSFSVHNALPVIHTISAAALFNISPADIKHIANLVVIIVILFAGMHVGSFMLSRLDNYRHERLEKRMYSDALGCQTLKHTGQELRVWRFTTDEVQPDPTDAGRITRISGTAVEFCELVGIPYARLACALPPDMLGGVLTNQCAGRAVGLRTDTRGSLDKSGRGSDAEQAKAEKGPAVGGAQAVPDLCMVASTALAHALLLSWCLANSDDVVYQQRLFISYLEESRVPDLTGLRFAQLFEAFKEMLIGGNLRISSNWLMRARFWRVILLARTPGEAPGSCVRFWDAGDALAFSLLANAHVPPVHNLHGLQRFTTALGGLVANAIGVVSGQEGPGISQLFVCFGALGKLIRGALFCCKRAPKTEEETCKDAAAAASGKTRKESLAQKATKRFMNLVITDEVGLDENAEYDVALPPEAAVGSGAGSDDVMEFHGAAILDSLPTFLLKACGDDTAAASRVWTTSLVAEQMRELQVCWRVSDAGTPLAEQLTLLDAALDWLAAQPGMTPEVLERASLAAKQQLAQWREWHDRRVTGLRSQEMKTVQHSRLQVHRAAAKVMASVVTGHPTLSLALTPSSIGFVRWMQFCTLVTGLMAMLCVSIWFYWNKGTICCNDLRTQLGCDPNPLLPCTTVGFTGHCGDLANWGPAQVALGGPYVCTAFPADGSSRDTFLAGLINFAVAIPVMVVLANCLSLSTSTDDEQLHSRTRFLLWPVKWRVLFGSKPWVRKPKRGRMAALKKWLAGSWSTSIWTKIVVTCADGLEAAVRIVLRRPAGHQARALDPLTNVTNVEAAVAFGKLTEMYKRCGYAVLYTCWAVFSWIIFAYGKEVYKLLGPASEVAFAKSWGIGVALSQVQDCQSLAYATLEAILVMTVMELFWLLQNLQWLEWVVDFSSVYAAAIHARAQRPTLRRVCTSYINHFNAVT